MARPRDFSSINPVAYDCVLLPFNDAPGNHESLPAPPTESLLLALWLSWFIAIINVFAHLRACIHQAPRCLIVRYCEVSKALDRVLRFSLCFEIGVSNDCQCCRDPRLISKWSYNFKLKFSGVKIIIEYFAEKIRKNVTGITWVRIEAVYGIIRNADIYLEIFKRFRDFKIRQLS